MGTLNTEAPYVIVGGGIAGVSAAEALRDCGFDGRIVLINEESTAPYDRPPLSKDVLRSSDLPQNIWLRNDAFYASRGIEVRTGVGAVAIDAVGKTVKLSDGDVVSYAKLLLATGSRARELAMFPIGNPLVHYLRTLDDAQGLRCDLDKLGDDGHLLVVGAGVIGLEVAAIARELGLRVTVVEAGARPLARSASPLLAAFLARAHADRGVDIRCGVTLQSADFLGDGYDVALSDGTEVHADVVLVAIGILPNAGLARSAGVEVVPEGIRTDGLGRTSVQDIYAAGEVAYHYNQRHQAFRREETWQHAADHGAHVARCMAGQDEQYASTMAYWTDQYQFSIQVFGNPHGTSEVIRGDSGSDAFSIFHLDHSAICGVTAVNAARELRKSKPLVLKGAVVPDHVISDPNADPYSCA
ncbi:3-phenylpropionate/trans-cinnamate dioxygenase ferredoxin reductase subunit/p-cumate 2,3-dioxygenase ferredoxin reductase subunit [Paraburkholderia lycopersici]|uniref:3-phenylpropionate/trans-cinnamate dioxygenase ferredoxin reductase subunit/p-cumate 2,3-dioxygenase ferredoxin reductase subunit n=2 Tax=Paraburkholderia lycopersici TaxID=416944 RepID=A0A1G6LVY7_9BURK|nr:3-phenylpropionate/trans-cinnamate dioxygenase ferredoxin reductase subunit/p-cumate 2,3-dioxygenase ferredoxin reductase subunit [Paraburkholderia lycopersici]